MNVFKSLWISQIINLYIGWEKDLCFGKGDELVALFC